MIGAAYQTVPRVASEPYTRMGHVIPSDPRASPAEAGLHLLTAWVRVRFRSARPRLVFLRSDMDLVVVTYAPDVKLLRHALASYELYYEDKDRFLVFTSRDDRYLFEQIDLPARCELIYREDIAELRDTTPYSHQTFLKLWAHNVVTTERYLIIDSDFLLVKPTRDRDFYRGDRPIWFYRPWVEGEPPLRWKAGTEKFVGESIDLCYGDIPQWV